MVKVGKDVNVQEVKVHGVGSVGLSEEVTFEYRYEEVRIPRCGCLRKTHSRQRTAKALSWWQACSRNRRETSVTGRSNSEGFE